jgi:hypothetical protein
MKNSIAIKAVIGTLIASLNNDYKIDLQNQTNPISMGCPWE